MKQLRIVFALLLVGVVSYQCTDKSNKATTDGLPPEVVATIEKRIQNGQMPSMALAIIDSSGVKYYNFGKMTLDGKPVDENTIYEIGSISKVFTAILLAQRVLDGDVKLEDEINDYLPDSVKVPVMGDAPITFGNLTDHTSGIPRMPTNFAPANPNNPYADYTVQQMYEFISNYEPIRTVGSEYEYSNLAQGLLGHLLAQNKNTTYEALMVATIADPLGMNDTRIAFTERMKQNLALGHTGPYVVENWDIPTLAGAGAIRSSTSDMAKFISANLGYVDTPLRAAMDMSHTMRHDKAGGMQVGMGWHIKNGREGDVIWHNGGTGGYRTFAGFVKETGKGVVVLTNSSTGADDIGFNLLDSGSELAEQYFKSDAVQVPESVLEQYVGVYELQPGFMITITREGEQLYGQPTAEERFEIYAENDTVFFQPEVRAKISFQVVDNGMVESLTLFQGGGGGVARKIE
ncbi:MULTISPECIES: serine hydrolase [unclassified Imperialibacter]|uniref:serine hydrolase n=1 Tax=unclassified Imperialibacter TaxID=2629706 RepID=UPI0012523426|nr:MULTISPECIES: serine hydrolase [unclassified Imperialibacter]CAD5271055.1 Beta-lactamase [Imperialibacter sp. 75]CAD5298583.1 Beta-lactamase [Imperialibacter sp. 89]VVT35654.1 Beta-lactamase [Imperialibacter sp. EC-SDR9]